MKDLILENSRVRAHVNAFGAELKGLEFDGFEYLYEGDPAYYGRTSPVVFPIMGRFLSDTYYVGDKAYHMGINGFAMDRNFRVVSKDESRAVFELASDERTLQSYPYPFLLQIFYQLKENGIRTMTIVTSTYHQRWGQAIYNAVAALYEREQGYTVEIVENYCFDIEPSREMYKDDAQIAIRQLASVLKLPKTEGR